MTDETARVIEPTIVPRQFWLVGGIHSAGGALLLGFVALIVAKFGADLLNGGRGDANLPTALLVAVVVFSIALLALWTLHYQWFVRRRGATTYAIYADRVEVVINGAPRPQRVIPLAKVAAVQTWTGPLLRPLGLATIILVVDEPSRRGGPAGHRWFPLPNVPEPDQTRDLLRSLIDRASATAATADD